MVGMVLGTCLKDVLDVREERHVPIDRVVAAISGRTSPWRIMEDLRSVKQVTTQGYTQGNTQVVHCVSGTKIGSRK